MPTISKQQYDEDVKSLPPGITEQGYVRGLLRNGYEIEGLNLSSTSKSYLETSDPTKYSTQDLQNVIGKPEGMIGAVGKGILGGVVGSAQAIYNMGRNAYNLVDHPLNAITAVPAIAAGAVEEGLAGLAAGGYKLATGNTIPDKYAAPETGSREAFRGFSKSIGLTDVTKGIVNLDPSQVLTGVDTGINFAYQNPDVAATTAEGAFRGINKKFGTDLTTPIEAGGKMVNAAKGIAPKVSNFLPWRSKTPNLDASIKESINQALRPSVMKSDAQANKYYDNAITATKDIASNKEFIELQDPNGGFMPKGSLPDSLETMKQANIQMKEQLYGKWNNLTKMATGKGAMADVQPIIDKYIEFANDKIMQTQYPELATWAETKATAFSNLGMIAPDQLQKMIQNWNSELDAYYRNPNPNDVSRTAVIAAVKNTANDVLSKMVEDQSVPLEYQGLFSELKKKYAAQKAIEADLNRRATVFARQNPQSLLDYSNILTVRDAVTALSQLDFKSLARGAATKLMTSWMKEQNNPNIMIKKMFQNIDSHIKSSSENPILQRAQEAITSGESKVGSPNNVNGLDTLPADILNPNAGMAQKFKSGTPPVKTGAGVDNSIGRSVDLSSVNDKTNPSTTKKVGSKPQSQQVDSSPATLPEPPPTVNPPQPKFTPGGKSIDDLAKQYGGVDNIPLDKLDDVEAMRVQTMAKVTPELQKKFPNLTPEEIASLTPEEKSLGYVGGSDSVGGGVKKSIADIRADKSLDVKINYGDRGGVMTRREFVDKAMKDGAKFVEKTYPDYAKTEKLTAELQAIKRNATANEAYNRAHFPRMFEIQDILDSGGAKKTQYFAEYPDGALIDTTKYEYQYAKNALPSPSPLEPLMKEARKYPTAEAFVNAQGTNAYHGTNVEFNSFDKSKLGVSTKAKSAEKGFWFVDNADVAKGYGEYASEKPVRDILDQIKIAEKNKQWDKANKLTIKAEEMAAEYADPVVIEAKLNLKNPMVYDAKGKGFLATDKRVNDLIDKAIAEGNDALIIKNLKDNVYSADIPATHTIVFNNDAILTKSQLIDLWKKANSQ